MPEHIPTNINASLYNAWFRKEYPELFECEIKEVMESCEECGFCEVSKGETNENRKRQDHRSHNRRAV